MVKISPSILSADFSRLGDEIKAVELAGADWIQFDVMDGLYVPNISFGAPIIASARKVTKLLPFDCHLMIQKPERYIKNFAEAGSNNISFHVESAKNPAKAIKLIKDFGCTAGIAVNAKIPVKKILPYLGKVDLALIMTVNAGFSGQSFIQSCLKKVETVAKINENEKLGLEIQVDGGINPETAKLSIRAGANNLVAASSIFKSGDYKKAIDDLRKI